MDRRSRSRRYKPSAEGLEGRQLLASGNIFSSSYSPYGSPPGVQVDGNAPVQMTIEAKRAHISNLPYFIGLLNNHGDVPQPTVTNIQNDLYAIVATLHQANSSDVASVNLDFRKAEPYFKIRASDAQAINRDFGAVLVSAGVAPNIVTDLQNQMKTLAQDATSQTNSQIVVTNEYATVLQLAQLSGRPLVYPDVPSLLAADHNGNVGSISVTHKPRPSLTGNYISGVNIQIVNDANNQVLGSAAVNSNGVYQVKFDQPLANGTYTVRVRVEDANFVSDPSPKFTFEVNVPTPKVKVTAASATPGGPLKAH